VSEVESCLRHATAELPPETWEALDELIATLTTPPAPGGEAQ
jgi:hypothetical protein